MLIIVMISVWLVSNVITGVQRSNLKNKNISMFQATNNVKTLDRSVVLKNQILKAYQSNVANKREVIIELLQQLHKFEDPGEFLEKNHFIQNYIFNLNKEAI